MTDLAQLIASATTFAQSPPLGTDPRRSDYCYAPCENGLHVCGRHPDGVNCLTVVNLPVGTEHEARALFEAAKQFACADGEPDDYVVDFQLDWSVEEDFLMSRQMLDPLIRLWAGGRALQAQQETSEDE